MRTIAAPLVDGAAAVIDTAIHGVMDGSVVIAGLLHVKDFRAPEIILRVIRRTGLLIRGITRLAILRVTENIRGLTTFQAITLDRQAVVLVIIQELRLGPKDRVSAVILVDLLPHQVLDPVRGISRTVRGKCTGTRLTIRGVVGLEETSGLETAR